RYQKASEVRAALETLQPGKVQGVVTWLSRSLVVASFVGIAVLILLLNSFGIRERLIGGISRYSAIQLAILPLENQTGDAEQDYVSDGLSDQMITVFSRLHSPRLSVTSRAESAPDKTTTNTLGHTGP